MSLWPSDTPGAFLFDTRWPKLMSEKGVMETAYLTTGGLVTHWGYLVFGTRSLRLKVFVTCEWNALACDLKTESPSRFDARRRI
ncbi:hypothetical protein F4823DRAFT_563312 [Ustulina deusta]|nr:hypothetical protein F4823DRAFT_563312 [Ustulina deusta]